MSHALKTITVILAFLLSSMAGGHAQEPWRAYEGHEAIEIPFANGPISRHHVPDIWLGLTGASPRRFGMDTGSTGIVVSAARSASTKCDSAAKCCQPCGWSSTR